MNKPVRLTLEVSFELNSTLEDLSAKTHCTKSEVLRRAIALMKFAVEARNDGLKIGVANESGNLVREIICL